MEHRNRIVVSEELLEFAEGGHGRASVIVEAIRPAASPPPRSAQRVAVRAVDTLPPPLGKRKGASPQSSPRAQMSALEKGLERLGLGDRARVNRLASSFTVEVTPSELRSLAKMDSVQAIRPNRRRRFASV